MTSSSRQDQDKSQSQSQSGSQPSSDPNDAGAGTAIGAPAEQAEQAEAAAKAKADMEQKAEADRAEQQAKVDADALTWPRRAGGDGAATGELVPGTPEHTAAGGAYPSVDQRPIPPAAALYFLSPEDMLTQLKRHAQETHGLAVDKEMFTKIHDYLRYHLAEAGFVKESEDESMR